MTAGIGSFPMGRYVTLNVSPLYRYDVQDNRTYHETYPAPVDQSHLSLHDHPNLLCFTCTRGVQKPHGLSPANSCERIP